MVSGQFSKVIKCLCLMLVLLSACGSAVGEEPEEKKREVPHHSGEAPNEIQETSKYAQNDPKQEQALADEAKKHATEMEQVTDVEAVSLDNHVYVSPEVKHRTRWNLKGFREEGRNYLSETMPDDVVIHFATDQKVNMELERLTDDIKAGMVNGEELDRRLEKIEELMMKG
ncbi:hypothetical protein HNR44_000934 [Geomicrobium halophilum]|uniref:Sporulation lipoprotein YhcN/YlaJ (Spore_YhcN_YlaJ) n=1 Tax=Geomicrobium halophilum TaxID=549000 RepID=A0A841PY24_9BACL|nr:YhcN/YlaJ family sporulation lipoprotein [Geomicrobium halophilum]MBB6448985.1 hypothetical protein [Geomicrobium halophilum]